MNERVNSVHEQRHELYDEYDRVDERECDAYEICAQQAECGTLREDGDHEGQPDGVDDEKHDETLLSKFRQLDH